MKRKLPPLVAIEWEDSAQAAPQWQWLSDVQAPNISICLSVGFLVKDTKREKALAISIANYGRPDHEQVAGIISIPTSCIKRMVRLPASSYLPLSGR